MQAVWRFSEKYTVGCRLLLVVLLLSPIQGCTLFAVADATASAAVSVTGTAVKATAATVDLVIPDGDDDDD